MAVTVADAVTTRDTLAVPGARSIDVPLDGCPMAGEANTAAMTTATRPHGNEYPTRIFDSLIDKQSAIITTDCIVHALAAIGKQVTPNLRLTL
jgi:hypothetical protein